MRMSEKVSLTELQKSQIVILYRESYSQNKIPRYGADLFVASLQILLPVLVMWVSESHGVAYFLIPKFTSA